MPFSRNAELVESWNWYRSAPRTGFHANDGVRGNECTIGSPARSRKPCKPVGTRAADVRAPAAGVSTSSARQTEARRAANIVLPRFRHRGGPGCPSKEGRQLLAGREDERVAARAADELKRCRQALLCRTARKRERWPAERVDGVRVARERPAQREVTYADARRDDGQRRRQQEIQPVDKLLHIRAVVVTVARCRGRLGVGDGQTPFDLDGDVLAVELGVLLVEVAMHPRYLVHEHRIDVGPRQLDVGSRLEARDGSEHAFAHAWLG